MPLKLKSDLLKQEKLPAERASCLHDRARSRRQGHYEKWLKQMARRFSFLQIPSSTKLLRAERRRPEELETGAAFGVTIAGDDLLVFLKCYREPAFATNARPQLVRQDRSGQPVHPDAKVLKPTQIHIRTDLSPGPST